MRPSRSRRRAAAEAEESEEEPRPARSRRRAAVAENDDIAEERPSRRTRRRAAVAEDEDAVEPRPSRSRRAPREDEYEDEDYAPRARSRRRARDHYDEDYDERAFDALDNLPDELGPADRQRPMTSLLFQEPVIPARGRRTRDDYDEDEYDSYDERDHRDDRRDDDDHDDRDDRDERDDCARRDGEPARSSRRTRSRRRGGAQHDAEAAETAQGQDERNGRNGQKNGQGTQDNQGAKGDDQSEESGHSRRGNRRLNAQERRAAAEVEQIEEDLELDDITYAPITEEDLSEGPVRSRRRRRRGGNGQNGAAQGEHAENETHEAEDEQGASSRRHRNGEAEDGEQTVTRRRRRRRGKGEQAADSGDDQILARRSRKQQYIDEITDIEGSTRLEAKKQRRRDNRRERSRQSQLMEQDFLARRENVERLMVVREKEHHTQISVVEDNVLVEHYVSDIQEVQTVGNIYLGRVQNVLPSMEAAFVDIGQARNGVLYAGEVNWDAARLEGQPRRIELAFKSGDPVLVQVTKDPIGHKGARLTSQVTLAGRFLVLVPSGGMTGVSRKLSERERSRLKGIVNKIAPKDMGVIIRTAAGGASEEAIVKDLESLVKQWEHITAKRDEFLHGKRPKLLQGEPDVAIRVVRDIFNDDFTKLIVEGDKVYQRIEEYLDTRAPDLRDKLERWDPADHGGKDVFDKWQIDSQLRKGMERQVYLPSGGSIVIDRTEAMTTIDVNTGRFIGRGKSLEETVTRCNLEASEEIARQLRLRDIGGMVMIDYVDMVMPANRDLVLRRLVECLARDRTKHQVAEVTSLGLVQMTRKRIGQGLVEAFSEECPTCKGRGFILHDKPTVSADYDDPYAMRGGDPFVKTNKHGRGTQPAPEPAGSSPDVKAKLAQIAAAAVAANNAEHEQH
ncbi:Rne/Rng family ribonuclease [Bifidobacterium pullorum]